MSRDLDEVIAAARELAPEDRRRLMRMLARSLGAADTWTTSDQAFRATRSIAQLAAEQSVTPLRAIADFVVDFWPEGESADDFVSYVHDQRRRDRANGQ